MTVTPQHITAVILAGGKGRRLDGNDKGLVNFRGKPLIEHILAVIQPQVGQVVINANRNQARYADYELPVLNDELDDFQGPLAGFATAMKQVSSDYILTLPCDGPFLSHDYALRMANALTTPGPQLAVAHDGERLQPVHALIPVRLLDSLIEFLQSGDRKIDRWYARHAFAQVDFSDRPGIFNNINTPEQLKRYEDKP